MIGLAVKGGSDAPGTLSFLVVFGMAVILFFLFRSLSKHLRKVSGPGPGQGAGTGAAASGPEPSAPASDDYPRVDAAAIRAARRAERERRNQAD